MGRIVVFMLLGAALCWVVLIVAREWHKRARLRRLQQEKRALADELDGQGEALPGGSPDNPVEVSTPAVVESRAASIACLHCQGDMRVIDHQARIHQGTRLRVATVECKQCGKKREIFFRLAAS